MRKKPTQQHGHYHLSLALVLILGAIIAYYNREDKQVLMLILVIISFLYVLWGIVHHHLVHDLSPKIVVEYIAMASLGLAVAVFLVKGFML